ncbi:MAG: hypothetical protein A2176_08605 [Spirochaetes bacterium RBG_13_51_14]|nr:MAG: hypothetical protein A2176_08605 [Spirochaetes bacterium RBG_13_51_14]
MDFKPSKNLPGQIAEYLGNRIMRFELKQGQRLVEEDLSRDLGVSRSPLREARVSVLNEYLIICTGDILKEIYGMMERKIVEKATQEDIQLITEKLSVCEKYSNSNDRLGYFDAIFKFENACLKAIKNIVLNRLLRDLWPASRRVQFATLSLRTESLNEHMKFFLDAHRFLLAGNGELAASAVRELIDSEIRNGVKYLPQFSTL